MNATFELLMLVSFLGAFDVLYYHLGRFRLYARPESVYEEVTHLLRTAIFIAITAIILFGDGSALARNAVVALVIADLVNNGIDVLLERSSREGLGGLPSLEYLVHIVASFLTGAAAATFWWHSSAAGFEALAPTTGELLRGLVALGGGVAILLIEGSLFARAVLARRPIRAAA